MNTPEGSGGIEHPGEQTSAVYRSAARRLRGRFARHPVRLQESLLELARREDARRGQVNGRPARFVSRLPNVVDGDAAEHFAVLVGQHLNGAVLYYTDRQTLLSAAGRLGIGRFEANLIIAAVQHRAETQCARIRRSRPEFSQSLGRWLPAIAIVLALEAALSFAAWWALCG